MYTSGIDNLKIDKEKRVSKIENKKTKMFWYYLLYCFLMSEGDAFVSKFYIIFWKFFQKIFCIEFWVYFSKIYLKKKLKMVFIVFSNACFILYV